MAGQLPEQHGLQGCHSESRLAALRRWPILDGDCLAKVIQEFGYKRTAWVLANTIQQLEWGGQYSSENKEWASRIYIPPDKSHNLNFVVPIRSAVLNGVVDQYRAAYQALGLFSLINVSQTLSRNWTTRERCWCFLRIL